jgi:hypothetical protein
MKQDYFISDGVTIGLIYKEWNNKDYENIGRK